MLPHRFEDPLPLVAGLGREVTVLTINATQVERTDNVDYTITWRGAEITGVSPNSDFYSLLSRQSGGQVTGKSCTMNRSSGSHASIMRWMALVLAVLCMATADCGNRWASATEGYFPPGDPRAGGIRDLMLIYLSQGKWETAEFLPYVAYLAQEAGNKPLDWFYDSYLFLAYGGLPAVRRTTTAPQTRMTGSTTLACSFPHCRICSPACGTWNKHSARAPRRVRSF